MCDEGEGTRDARKAPLSRAKREEAPKIDGGANAVVESAADEAAAWCGTIAKKAADPKSVVDSLNKDPKYIKSQQFYNLQ